MSVCECACERELAFNVFLDIGLCKSVPGPGHLKRSKRPGHFKGLFLVGPKK